MTLTAADVRATDFPAASRLRRGYDADAVDAFVERIAVRLETGAGLSSNDVYHVPFAKAGLGGRGYNSAEVDSFLERVHVELVRIEDAWGHENAGSAPVAAPDPDSDSASDIAATDDAGERDAPALPADGEALAEIAIADPADTPAVDDHPTDDTPAAADDAPAAGPR